MLGLDPANGHEANIASAHELEDFDRTGVRPFHTWATLTQAALDATERDCFLLFEMCRPLDDRTALQARIDRKLAEYDAVDL